VIVIYNSAVPESKDVAEYYARKRDVPPKQVLGFALPETESMTRDEYLEKLERPLWNLLQTRGLFKVALTGSISNLVPGSASGKQVAASSIRYAALCYKVPTKIAHDSKLIEPVEQQLQPELRRNGASVDSQLAILPLCMLNLPWAGPVTNPFFGITNGNLLHPTNGILLVTRLDGPSATIARGLVDKAMQAERDGLWGRAYVDGRGITNGPYKVGDDMMRGASNVLRNMGFETVTDEKPETFSPGFPLSQVAFYAGWYDWNVSGPFTQPNVEFMPGAFAYHLHSFSAETIRATTKNWVGPLLDKGATTTMGCVDEPYLGATPDIAVFLARFTHFRFSFGEAAWAAQNSLSWQNIAVGDPLYRPFWRGPQQMHEALEARQSKLVEWSHLSVVNLNLNLDPNPRESIQYLEGLPITRNSPVLKEKLADLYWANRKLSDAIDTDSDVLKLNPSPQQRIRVLLTMAARREALGPPAAAFELYEQFLKEYPDYPDQLVIYQKLLPLARRLNRTAEAKHFEDEIRRLTPPPAKS
jgi:uncharacterized protein (TIGR03790 family)